MEQIVSLFLSIGEFVTSVFQFLIDTVEGLAYCVKLLAYFTLNIPSYFEWLPESCLAVVVLIIGVAVTYKILGREG